MKAKTGEQKNNYLADTSSRTSPSCAEALGLYGPGLSVCVRRLTEGAEMANKIEGIIGWARNQDFAGKCETLNFLETLVEDGEGVGKGEQFSWNDIDISVGFFDEIKQLLVGMEALLIYLRNKERQNKGGENGERN
jgi:hypothetical protein